MPNFTPTIGLAATLLCVGSIAISEGSTQAAVDASFDAISSAIQSTGLEVVVEIDHARLAAAEDVEMPPSRVQLFSDAALEAGILENEIRAGLDLPFRVLSYAEGDQVRVAYTDATFLSLRHGLDIKETADAFDATLLKVLDVAEIEGNAAPTESLTLNYGIIELVSSYDFETTIDRLEKAVMSQGDTVWFGEVDFTARAAAGGIDLSRATLLLFGGPAPGGVAMAQFPVIGLDAFCQKLLVYVDADETVKVIFNDIAALAELHYGQSDEPHHVLNQRLTKTFAGAVN